MRTKKKLYLDLLAIAIVLCAGCASTMHVKVIDSNGTPIPHALVYWMSYNKPSWCFFYPGTEFPFEKGSDIRLTDTNGIVVMTRRNRVTVGKGGYYPAIVFSAPNSRLLIEETITLFRVGEESNTVEQTIADDLPLYKEPHGIPKSQVRANEKRIRYLEWLQTQPKRMSWGFYNTLHGGIGNVHDIPR